MSTNASHIRPWYRHVWPWALMAAPAASIAMGVVMVLLALGSEDGLVVEDYYKRGLAINQVLARESRAAELGLAASLAFSPERTRVRLVLAGAAPALDRATLRLVHPTRTGQDQTVTLAAVSENVLEGALAPPAGGRWRLVLEDPGGEWRVAGTWNTDEAVATLGATVPGR
jgi:hypothetical protein